MGIDDVLRLVQAECVLLVVELDLGNRKRIVGELAGNAGGRARGIHAGEQPGKDREWVGAVSGQRVIAACQVRGVAADDLVDGKGELDGEVVDETHRAAEADRIAVAMDENTADGDASECRVDPVRSSGIRRWRSLVSRPGSVQPILHPPPRVIVVVPDGEELAASVLGQALAAAVTGIPLAARQRHQYFSPLVGPHHRYFRAGDGDAGVLALAVDVDRVAIAVVIGAAAILEVEQNLLPVGRAEFRYISAKPAGGGGEGTLDLAKKIVGVGDQVVLYLSGLQRRQASIKRVLIFNLEVLGQTVIGQAAGL